MNPANTDQPARTMYGFPLAHWTLPAHTRTPLTGRIYTEALAVLTEPHGPVAALWARETEQDGYRAITAALTLPQIVSLVSELPDRAIVALTGVAPTDGARQEIVRMLFAPAEG